MKISIVGTGNMAFHLTKNFLKTGHKIVEIIGRDFGKTKLFADSFNCNYTSDFQNVKDADVYFLCVSDKSIKEVANNFIDKFSVHTSGSVDVDFFSNITKNYGVFYPVQTISNKVDLNFENIPIAIEANSFENTNKLKNIAEKISNNVFFANSQTRKSIHISAIFFNNFVNYMCHIGQSMLEKQNISSTIFNQLLEQTVLNIKNHKPYEIQTGPARRNDFTTINEHISILSKIDKNYADLYQVISNSIIKEYHK